MNEEKFEEFVERLVTVLCTHNNNCTDCVANYSFYRNANKSCQTIVKEYLLGDLFGGEADE